MDSKCRGLSLAETRSVWREAGRNKLAVVWGTITEELI